MSTPFVNRILLAIVALLPIAVSVKHGAGVGGVAIVSLVAAYILLNLDRFRKVKAGLGEVEGELKETIKEAKDTLVEIREVAVLAAITQLSSVIRSGRWGSYDEEEKEKIKNDIVRLLRQLDIDSKVIEEKVLSDWRRVTRFDYASNLLGNKAPPQRTPEWQALRELLEQGLENPPTPEQIKDFYEKSDRLTYEVDELIKDYQYYIDNGEHRSFERWENHHKWDFLT